jgi:uncharacterized protein (TIGR02302 family)
MTPRSNAATFERKIRLSRWAQLFERLWPRAWALLGIAALFVLVSLAGIWTYLPELAHVTLLGVFGLACLAALFWMARTPFPTREEALRRLELRSSVPHRPASSYEDTLSSPGANDATQALWEAHRARLAATLARLRVGTPSPRADRADPWALRAVLLIGVGVLAAAVGDGFMDRLSQAFRFGTPATAVSTARLDAWVTPPAYTARPPLMLVDGSRHDVQQVPGEMPATFEVPVKSALVVRASGEGASAMTLEITDEGGKVEVLSPKKPQLPPGVTITSEVAEIRSELARPVSVRVRGVNGEPQWAFRIIPDHLPKISLTKAPEGMPRGSLKLSYKVEDDYGIASAEARITRVHPKPGDPATSWARPKKQGARPPLEKPPVLSLRLPRMNAKQADGTSYHELSGHPWAGMRVRMVLSAKDQAGQVGKSEPVEFILPQRRFYNPIARAVVEQRRALIEDPRNRDQVLIGLDAIAVEPDGFFPDYSAYISLRGAYWRLMRDKTRAGMKDVVDQLWHVAVRLEDGNLSDAERRLRQAQEDLAKALQQGASDEEIQRLMNELRQALNEFMEQLARQAEGQPPQQMPPGQSPQQMLSQRDLERMMRDIENMARQGSRENAQQMLSQLRDLLERLQSGRMARQQGQQNQQMMQMMDQFGDVIRRQQQLLDDTFNEQRQAGEEGQEGEQGQQQGQQGQQGRQGQHGQRGQRGQRGRQGQGQQGQQGRRGYGELGQRQGQLRDRLGQLGQGLQKFGMQPPSQLGGAQRSMEEAEQALREGDLDGAARAEQRALEQLRQGAQQMAQQMLQRMPGQLGRNADVPLDPMGRPQRTEGPDPGTSVKVPDEIDIQRAREILEELRRRLGDQQRPVLELDYIERLLRRF